MSIKDHEKSLPKWRVDLRKSGNPYAAHYYDPSGQEQARTAKEFYHLSENPHAREYYLGDVAVEAHAASLPDIDGEVAVDRKRLSKSDFEAGCRAVFRRYMPEMERSKLRPHHQDFIRRNSAASPERRYALLQELRRYDLTNETGLRTYFNREEDAFTEAKLRKIEESAKQG